MFNFSSYENAGLDEAITQVLNDMKSNDPDTETYATLVKRLDELYKIRNEDRPKQVDPNTVITALGSVAGILIIVKFEQYDVLTSKALGFVLKR